MSDKSDQDFIDFEHKLVRLQFPLHRYKVAIAIVHELNKLDLPFNFNTIKS